MVRTVKVRLELDRDDYKRGLRDAASDVRGFDAEVRTAGKDVHAMGVEVKAAGTQVEAMGTEVDTAAKKTAGLGDETAKAKEKTKGFGEESTKTKEKTKGFGEESDKTRAKVVGLTADIDKAKSSLAAMGEEFRKSGKIDMSAFNRASRDLREFERIRADLDKLKPTDDKSGGSFLSRFAGNLKDAAGLAAFQGGKAGELFGGGFLSSTVNVFAGAWPYLAPVVAGLAAFIGAALSGAALAGTGLGGLAAALALQFHDPHVYGAITDLGSYLLGQLTDATGAFPARLVQGFGAFKREIAPLWADLRAGFDSLAPYAANFLAKLGQGVALLGPGLRKVLEAAGPMLAALGQDMPMLLHAVGMFFDQLSRGSKGATEGLHALLSMIALSVMTLGVALRGLSAAFDFIVQSADKLTGFLAKIPGLGDAIKPLHDNIHQLATSFERSQLSADGTAGALDGFYLSADAAAGGAGGAAGAVQDMSASMSAALASMTGLDGAAISVNQSVQTLKDSIAQNGTSLDINTAAGQANVQAMLAGVTSAEALRKAQMDSGLSAAYADDQYLKNVGSLRDVMLAAGMNAAQVEIMIGKYLNVPGLIKTNVELAGAVDAINKGASLRDILNSLDGKVSRSSVITTYLSEKDATTGGSAGPRGGVVTYKRWGGITEHAETGLLRDAGVYSAVSSGARYAFAEPATGGEAFVPKNGDYGRSMSILGQAASWYGARVTPGGGGAPVVNNITIPVNAGMGTDGYRLGQQIAEALRPFVSRNGNSVQMAIVGRQVP